MKITLKLLCLLLVLNLVSCGEKNYEQKKDANGILHHYNTNKPNQKDFKISLKKILEIDGNNLDSIRIGLPIGIASDSASYFISDFISRSIYQFSKRGRFIKKIGRKGQGPGEFQSLGEILSKNDTLIATDPWYKKISFFDKQLNFVKSINKDKMPIRLNAFQENFVGPILNWKKLDTHYSYGQELILYDKNFKPLRSISSIETTITKDAKGNPLKAILANAVANDGKIYVPQMSEDKYLINVFDLNGKLIEKIHKPYIKKQFTQDYFDKNKKELNMLCNIQNPHKKDIPYHLAIYDCFVDHKNRLWITSFKGEIDKHKGVKFDIFDKGKYLNSVYFELESIPAFRTAGQVKIIGENLAIINQQNQKISIYEIEG